MRVILYCWQLFLSDRSISSLFHFGDIGTSQMCKFIFIYGNNMHKGSDMIEPQRAQRTQR